MSLKKGKPRSKRNQGLMGGVFLVNLLTKNTRRMPRKRTKVITIWNGKGNLNGVFTRGRAYTPNWNRKCAGRRI